MMPWPAASPNPPPDSPAAMDLASVTSPARLGMTQGFRQVTCEWLAAGDEALPLS